MSVVSKIFNYFGYRRVNDNFCALRINSGGSSFVVNNAVPKDVALAIPAFFSGVRIISNTIASLNLKLVDNENRENTTHPLARLLRSPNQYDTLYDIVQLVICDLVLHGKAFLLIDRNVSGQPQTLTYAAYENVSLREETKDFQINLENGTRDYAFRDVVFLQSNYFPCSALSYYTDTVQLANLLIKNNINFFRNSARPGLIFKYPMEIELTDEQRAEHIQNIIDTYSNDEGKFTPIIADRGLEVDSLEVNFQSSQVIEQREFIVKEIARLLNIPLSKMGVMGNTKSSVTEENNHFVHHTLKPIARIIETKFDKYLLTDQSRPRLRFSFDFNPLLYGTLRDKAQAFRVNADLGIFSKEELRTHVYGLPAVMNPDEEPAMSPNTNSELIGDDPSEAPSEAPEDPDENDEEI